MSTLQGRRSRVLMSLTGLRKQELESLLPSFRRSYVKASKSWTQVTEDSRVRARGAGKRAGVSQEDALVMILLYFRLYPTQDLLALLFGGTQAWACKWVHRLTPVLEAALGKKKQLPARPKKRISTLEELIEQCPDLSFIIDGTERPVQRPKDKEQQKSRYSGKKKRHTVKNTVVSSTASGRIVALGSTFEGRTHDKRMLEEEPITFPKGSIVYQDTGYQGYSPPGEQIFCLQPTKKKRGQQRSEADKKFNKVISRTRVRVEHAIGGAKRSRITSDIFRNRKHGFEDKVLFVAAGLHNLRAHARGYLADVR